MQKFILPAVLASLIGVASLPAKAEASWLSQLIRNTRIEIYPGGYPAPGYAPYGYPPPVYAAPAYPPPVYGPPVPIVPVQPSYYPPPGYYPYPAPGYSPYAYPRGYRFYP